MSLRTWIASLRRKRAAPRIDTPWGPVSESARRQAAENMRNDPALRVKVERIVIIECGGDITVGLALCRRRYPEAYKGERPSAT